MYNLWNSGGVLQSLVKFKTTFSLGLNLKRCGIFPRSMSLPTKGRVLIVTSVGDIEIELWANVRVFLLPFLLSTLNFLRKRRKHVEILLHLLLRVNLFDHCQDTNDK